MAAHLNVSMARVSQMASGVVPTKYMLAIRHYTFGAVTLEEMVEARTPSATADQEA